MNISSRYHHLDVEHRASGVTVITMNRPEVLNAVNWDMHSELEHLFVDLDQDKSVKAIVLTGAGRGFVLGVIRRQPILTWFLHLPEAVVI